VNNGTFGTQRCNKLLPVGHRPLKQITVENFMFKRVGTSMAFWDCKRNRIPFRFVQLLVIAAGMALIIWAFFDSRFRDAEGFVKGTFCLPVSVGVALITLGWTLVGHWRQAAFWFALALAGQAVSLQMIEAGPLIHYQHYKSLNQLLTGTGPVLLLFLGIQTAFVTVGVGKRWPSISAWIGSTFKTWQLLGVGLIFVVSSAALSRDLSAYFTELFIATFVQLVNLGNILLMVWAIPREALGGIKRGVERFFGRAEDQDRGSRIEGHESKIQNRKSSESRVEGRESSGESRKSAIRNPKHVLSPSTPLRINSVEGSKIQNCSVDRFAIVAAIWIFALAGLLNYFVYQRHPHIPDEIIYLYHARYFAAGWLTVPAPPVPEAFSLYMIPERSANWYSIFPPGWPAILAVGVLLGVPWMVNPLLAGVNVLLSYIFVQELYDRRVARIVVLLLCVSPWHVFMSMNFMAHTFTLTCALAGSLAMARAKRSGKTSWGLAAGLATGVASLIRPLDGFIVGILLGAWGIGLVGSRLKALPFAAFLFGAGIVSALTLPYNRLLTGDAFVFPLTAYYEEYFGPKTNAFGFGPERGLGWALDAFPGHTPLEAVLNALLNIFSINIELFGWSIGSILGCALILASRRMRKNDYCVVAGIVAVVGFYSFYWFNGGPDFGARYWYLIILPTILLTVRAIQFLESTVDNKRTGAINEGSRVLVGVFMLSFMVLINYLPWRAIDKYHHYLGMRPDIRSIAENHGFRRSLVLIRGAWYPDYASAWPYSSLDRDSNAPVYAWDKNPEVRANVVEAYSDRPIWVVNGPSITHRDFAIIAGPVTSRELMARESERPQVRP
jgi:dolichyl-phosphate-mannose-protein mannosyltransferase